MFHIFMDRIAWLTSQG